VKQDLSGRFASTSGIRVIFANSGERGGWLALRKTIGALDLWVKKKAEGKQGKHEMVK